ncbi:unnamed protein product [Oikopleura dioica]|uniref:Uncharacterized protein n=1 Tax=Oikopleura dioica TaxID=34765 RepID=E4WUA8_OIKDI|nr:unnamed protein product [Oikopleura dioica]
MFSDNISYTLTRVICDQEEIKLLVKNLENATSTFFEFEKTWMDLADNSRLIKNLASTTNGKRLIEKLESVLRTLRCSSTNPELDWTTEHSIIQRQVIKTVMDIDDCANTSFSMFVDTWREIACNNGNTRNYAFRLDHENNLTALITQQLKKRNGRAAQGISFIYIVRQNYQPILISFKNGIFGVLDLSREPETWVFRRDQGTEDEIKPIFAEERRLDSRYLTASIALGINLEP